MVPINPTLTFAGLALFPQPATPGLNQVELTHVALGSAKYDPTGLETALVSEVARYPIGAGGIASPTSVRIGVTVKNEDPYGRILNDQWIGEIGFYAGSTLFAIWSRADKFLFHKSAEYDVPVAYTLDVSSVPADSVTVIVQLGDAAMQVMLFGHEGASDPHPQYLLASEGAALVSAHEAVTDPHPQYLIQSEGDSRYAQLGSLRTADVLKALRGARALRFFHSAGM
jgi:hypothetical protein